MSAKSPKTSILVTGATGYLASHTIIQLLEAGYDVIGIDNLVRSKKSVISRITKMTDRSMIFRVMDIRDRKQVSDLFDSYSISAVIHFAGYKAVNESVKDPMLYYSNNLKGSITLFEVMQERGVKNLVFSSSCTVYGDPEHCPITEESPLSPKNPYGRSKMYVEHVLQDLAESDKEWNIISLRYFNPIGAHESGNLGEDPLGIPNNLLPFITQTALGKRDKLQVFGGDYDTHDGTCVRDYIHVCDLAAGHIAALETLNNYRYEVFNLGTGVGYSVLDVISTFEKVTGQTVSYEIVGRREGDAAEVYADPSKAYKQLYWKAKKTLDDMCLDAYNWQVKNPDGYPDRLYNLFSSDDVADLSTEAATLTKTTLRKVESA
jgi:UDP-glucose 4-epimerase